MNPTKAPAPARRCWLVAIPWLLHLTISAPLLGQEQRVVLDPAPVVLTPDSFLDMAVVYDTDPPEDRLTGLGLRLHWSSAQLALPEMSDLRTDGLVASGNPEPDVFDLDDDPSTDTFLHLAWADRQGTWTGTGEGPATLYRIRFEVTAEDSQRARLGFTASSTAAGYRLGPPLVIFRDGFESGDAGAWSLASGVAVPSLVAPGGAESGGSLTEQLIALGGELPTSQGLGVPLLDIDGDGLVGADHDGVLILRHLFGFTGSVLADGALAPGATRTNPEALTAYLAQLGDALDVDLDGRLDALTDGLLIWRALSGLSGEALTRGALGLEAERFEAAEILAYVEALADPEGAGDRDGDGVSDYDEVIGHSILIDLDGLGLGGLTERMVSSDPFTPDTDGDGLDDFRERLLRTDPASSDTDEDGLTDRVELEQYGSAPASVDSDGDSRGDGASVPNPLFFDGSELEIFQTSPTLADTDGDGDSDFTEANQNGTPPLVAAVPRLAIDFAEPVRIELDTELTQNQTMSFSTSELERQSASTSGSRTDSSTTELSIGGSVSLTAGAEVGFPKGGSISAEATVTVSGEYSDQSTSSFTEGSSLETQNQFQTSQEESISEGTAILGGRISSSVKVRNVGEVAFTVSNLVINVRHRDPEQRDSFRSIATLIPELPDGSITLGAFNGETGPLRVSDNDMTAQLATSLMSDPSGLLLEIATFDILDANGRNFAFLADVTNARTALLTLDPGDGEVERFRVATLVDRLPDGTGAGLSLGRALTDILGIPFTTAPRSGSDDPLFPNGVRLLTSVRGLVTDTVEYEGCRTVEPEFQFPADPRNAFWAVLSPDPELTGEQGEPFTTDFEDIRLRSGDTLSLAYLFDVDRDGLFRREEFLYATLDAPTDLDGNGVIDNQERRRSCDFDLDGLGDFFEIRTGWTVQVAGQPERRVFSDPTRADTDAFDLDEDGATDGDGLDDLQEFRGKDGCGPHDPRDPTRPDPMCLGAVDSGDATDPTSPDTDRDGLHDNVDPNPLSASNMPPTFAFMTSFDPVTGILRLTGEIDDATDDIAEVVIDWGDGMRRILPGGPAPLGIEETYQYLMNAPGGGFTVRVTATDDRPAPGTPQTGFVDLGPFAPTLADDEIAHFPFTDGSLVDEGGDFDAMVLGTSSRARATADRFGFSGAAGGAYCLSSDQLSDCAAFTVPPLPIEDEMSLVIWMLRDQPEGLLVGQPGYAALEFVNNELRFSIDDGVNAAVLDEPDRPLPPESMMPCDQDGAPVPDREEWRLYAATVAYDGSDTTLRLYRGVTPEMDEGAQGIEVQLAAEQVLPGVRFTNPDASAEWQIGGNVEGSDSCSNNYRGRLDDVRVYDRALSRLQVEFLAAEEILP